MYSSRGQPLSVVRGLLASAGLSPRHAFGQNFLIDLNLLGKLLDAAELSAADTVLEVGPGTGSLSEALLSRGVDLVAVEIDRGLCELLGARFGADERFTLVGDDVLASKHSVNPAVIAALRARPPRAGGAYKLVANLPYQAATPLLIELLIGDVAFERMAVTIQREVGERLAAAAGGGDYGPISVVAQLLAEVSPVAMLPPTAFWPAPKVESMMIQLRPRPRAATGLGDARDFALFVQRAFQQRRKTLRRVLRGLEIDVDEAALAARRISLQQRPEQLDPGAWRELYSRRCLRPG